MTDDRSIDDKLRAVARLRDLAWRLPHIPTEQERRLLARFDELAANPAATTAADVEALVVGWRAWWREKRIGDITAMANVVSPDIIENDEWLVTYAVAARITSEGR